jgi:predicted P-loop ATPase
VADLGTPAPEAIAAVHQKIAGAISNNTLYPFGTLDAVEGQLLVDLFRDDPSAAHRLFDSWCQLASELGWGEKVIAKRLARTHFKQTADKQDSRDKALGTNLDRSAERNTQAYQRQQREQRATGGLTAEEMVMRKGSTHLQMVGYLLQHRPRRIWFDDFFDHVLLDWKGGTDASAVEAYMLTDAVVLRVMTWFHMIDDDELGGVNPARTRDAINAVADTWHRNASKDELLALPAWDGVVRLDRLLPDYYGTADTAYHHAVGRNWLIAMVARTFDPGCKVDTMPVMQGLQGLRKSTSIKVIAGEKFYFEVTDTVDHKDFQLGLRGKRCAELSELISMMTSRHGANRIKALLSIGHDWIRRTYGIEHESFSRTAVPIGTTNDLQWHGDHTGGRRYWPFVITRVELERITADRAQLWAEALHRYKAGESWWIVPDDEHAAQIESVLQTSEFMERVELWLGSNDEIYDGSARSTPLLPRQIGERIFWGTVVTPDRIATQALGLKPRDLGMQGVKRKISDALLDLKWTRVRHRVVNGEANERTYFWVRTANLSHDHGTAALRLTQEECAAILQSEGEQDDRPF